ncbi:hypothetical protein PCANC_19652 [Puccinia coronata f. sp. avenae]|uniref:Uncharacterized protein n=1 Tax=Puccinia coronata f. sp. avenae TaxID=200324 RepID=A0A2N5UHY8_9BASI|nr:hypothetical protein PCANC_19652 [Puccinia coronata f. sp. avenae]
MTIRDDLIQCDDQDDTDQFEGLNNQQKHEADDPSHHSSNMQDTNQNTIFDLSNSPSGGRDITMGESVNLSNTNNGIDQVCDNLQSKLQLNPEHLKVALLASKCSAEARHVNLVFSNAAFHQIGIGSRATGQVTHAFDNRFKDFVRSHARMILLNPKLEAYSNNPHKNGTLPKTLYYLTLPDDWKDDHLPPAQLRDSAESLEAYRDAVGELLKHQQSNLRMLLLSNILSTKRISINGPVPNRHEMVSSIYQELPPKSKKMTAAQIQVQVHNNWAMRIRMSYARLVMVHYYVHKAKKTSQWAEIDERLGVLRASLPVFQKIHAQLVLDEDFELFSHKRTFLDIPSNQFTVPTLDDVHNLMPPPEPLAAANVIPSGD